MSSFDEQSVRPFCDVVYGSPLGQNDQLMSSPDILTECQLNWVKFVDFLLIAYFWATDIFASTYCIYLSYADILLGFSSIFLRLSKPNFLCFTKFLPKGET